MLKLKFNLSGIALFPALAIPLITSNYMFGALQTAKTIIEYEETGLSNHDLLLATKKPGAWRMKHENYKLKVLYDQGMRTGDKQTLKLFLSESEKFLQFAPFIHLSVVWKQCINQWVNLKKLMRYEKEQSISIQRSIKRYMERISNVENVRHKIN